MKLTHLLFAAAVIVAPLAHAQSDTKHGHEATGHAAPAASHTASGVVKSVDVARGSVSIAHGPVETLKWPAMTMSFKARDKKLLERLKPGQKIDFEFVQQGKAYIVTRVK